MSDGKSVKQTKESTVTSGRTVKAVEQNGYCLSIAQYSGFFELGQESMIS